MATDEITPYGLARWILDDIVATCAKWPSVERVILFGSRATGRFRAGSDVDLAIDAPTLGSREFSQLVWALDDLPILFRLDVHHLQNTTERIRNKLARDGVTLFEREDTVSHR